MGVQDRLDSETGARPVFFVDPNQRSADEDASRLLKSSPISLRPNDTPAAARPRDPAMHARPLEYAGPAVAVLGAFAAIAYFFGLFAAVVVLVMIAALMAAGGIWVLNNTPSP